MRFLTLLNRFNWDNEEFNPPASHDILNSKKHKKVTYNKTKHMICYFEYDFFIQNCVCGFSSFYNYLY